MTAIFLLIVAGALALFAEKTRNPLWSLGLAVVLIAAVLVAERLIVVSP